MSRQLHSEIAALPPPLSDAPVYPNHSPPSALQDIYELKDQIQDVEGRYMQGLKELKVEGLELSACLPSPLPWDQSALLTHLCSCSF